MSLSKFSVLSVFSNMLYSKKRKPGKAGNQQTALQSRKYPWIDNICNYEKTAKKQTIWLVHQSNFYFKNEQNYFQRFILYFYC